MQSDTKRIDMKTRKNLMFQDLNLKKKPNDDDISNLFSIK